jgi:hypothetical protein
MQVHQGTSRVTNYLFKTGSVTSIIIFKIYLKKNFVIKSFDIFTNSLQKAQKIMDEKWKNTLNELRTSFSYTKFQSGLSSLSNKLCHNIKSEIIF